MRVNTRYINSISDTFSEKHAPRPSTKRPPQSCSLAYIISTNYATKSGVSRTVDSLSISMGSVCSRRVGVLEDCELFFFRLRAGSWAFLSLVCCHTLSSVCIGSFISLFFGQLVSLLWSYVVGVNNIVIIYIFWQGWGRY